MLQIALSIRKLFVLFVVSIISQTAIAETTGSSTPIVVLGSCQVYQITENYCPGCDQPRLQGVAYTKGDCNTSCQQWINPYFSYSTSMQYYSYNYIQYTAEYASTYIWWFPYSTTGECRKATKYGYYGYTPNCTIIPFGSPIVKTCG